ncbi:hypothetical protein RGQ29_029832 [Quercus rubra]|uniref:Uncharacterized protein n=1 Tax=Quercus rubra TaxID=3512 RepID=A0AAN7EGT9_QUERU|nr:hypothetical protein RGQ29_029832 [Quercus rubra]KAK4571159.1 hypothetical protein RGQ29_029832 [Quercus rubra]KAK4571160.1 hypothetical protein RGQ29_029832 [Quercus rubra]
MAASGARATRQQTANYRFAQEDSRRAPNFFCSPSSSSKSESDVSPDSAANGPDHPSPMRTPHKSYSDPPTNMRWWLNLQPNFGHHKDFTHEQLNALEAELEVLSSGFVNKTTKINEDHQTKEEVGNQTVKENNSFMEKPWDFSASCLKNENNTGMGEVKDVLSNDSQKTFKKKDLGEFWYLDDKFMGLDSFNCLVHEQAKKLSSDLGSDWVGAEKTETWWRTAGQDELASLVAQRSLEHIENCDLPRPQAKHFRKGQSAHTEHFHHDESLASSLDQTVNKGFSNLENRAWESSTTDYSQQNSDQHFSHSIGNSTTKVEPDDDPSKTELLEALCHSQTRAREAEKAAEQAYADKEHVVALFFKQASQLFAYKQWFQLLQLENLCLQRSDRQRRISTRLEREGVVNEGVRLENVLLLLQWGWVLPVLVCSLVGPWDGCFHLFKLILYYGCQ